MEQALELEKKAQERMKEIQDELEKKNKDMASMQNQYMEQLGK
jgi:hypothetical protein